MCRAKFARRIVKCDSATEVGRLKAINGLFNFDTGFQASAYFCTAVALQMIEWMLLMAFAKFCEDVFTFKKKLPWCNEKHEFVLQLQICWVFSGITTLVRTLKIFKHMVFCVSSTTQQREQCLQ